MNNALLLDTNVWLAHFVPDRTDSAVAQELVRTAIAADMPLLIASTSLKDLYYLIQGELKRRARQDAGVITEPDAIAIRELAWGCVEIASEIATVVPVDSSDVRVARKARRLHPDFEDNLVVAAAIRANAAYLVTSDMKLIAHALVATLSPADALKLIA